MLLALAVLGQHQCAAGIEDLRDQLVDLGS